MSYILTYKKKEFYPLEPKIEDIDIIRTSTGDTPWVDEEQDHNL